MNAFIDLDYFTAIFFTLFPFKIRGHLSNINKDRLEKVSLKAFIKYTILYYSLL